MMLSRVRMSIVLVVLLTSTLPAAEGNGGYAGAFFQIPVGARPTALGGAYLAVSDDGAGPLFNPAGLADLKRPLFASSYRMLALDRALGYVTLIFPTRGESAVGVHWLYAGSGDVTARDQNGRDLGRQLSYHSHAFSVLFAKKFEDYISVGLNAKYLHAAFAEMTAYTVSFDVGLMLYINQFFSRETRDLSPAQDIRVGLTVKHLAAEYAWNNDNYINRFRDPSALGTDQDDAVPIEIGLGCSARFFKRRLLVAMDVRKGIDVPNDVTNRKNEEQGPFFHAGAEYLVSPEFALRGGFSDGRLTAGTGYVFEVRKRTLAIDYAFSTDKVDEGSEHIFSLDLLF